MLLVYIGNETYECTEDLDELIKHPHMNPTSRNQLIIERANRLDWNSVIKS